ncbi:hypothetical protein COL5a_003721 [Colletotrichum fioriniae]|nr:hypothetical protein COL5a_003721 [Colletotrichum fioriniae]
MLYSFVVQLVLAGLYFRRVAAADVAKGAYIIEYAEDHNPAALLEYLAADATKRRDFNFTLFKGLSVQFHDVKNAAQHASAILDMPGIKSVWPVQAYDLPQHDVLWSGGSQSSSSATTERESVRQVSANDSFSTHVMTQVDKLRNEGIVGSGIRVAVIDTGVDYLHPALGGCFGPGCLVSWGADLVGDAYNGTNNPVSGPDPMDCNGHGTHVAGIIAAQPGNPVGVVGAATGVSLGAYRVFGCSGKVTNDVVIAAYNMAYEAGADIITTSIGGASGWAEEPWAVAVDRIVEKGVSCLLSAGNSGSFGLFYASTAANGHKATAIASVDNTEVPILLQNSTYAVGDTFDTPIPFGFSTATASNWGNVTLPLWAVNFDTTDPANGCDVFSGTTPDLSGHIVLIRRGTCTFTQKSTNAAAKGAKYIIFYSDIIGTIPITAVVPGIEGMAMVTASQGAEWISKLEEGANVLVHMVKPTGLPSIVVSEKNTVTPGFLSVDSSWGPTYELDIKPQFAAPGGMVLSTFPRSKGYYAVLTGTSMACPLAAGIYALLMEARGTKDPGELETVISSTSMPAKFHDGRNESQFLAPVPQQGSGLIQAYDAARVQTVLSVSSLSFNDTDNFTPMRKFTIRNTSARPIRYELGHTGANTAYTFAAPSDIVPDAFPNDLVQSYAEISFSPSSSVTIPAGQELAITVHLASPAGLDGRRLPVYSGYVTVTSAGGDNLSVPYMGVSGSMRSLKVLDSASTFLTSASDGTGSPAAENKTWTLPPLDTPSNSSAGIYEYPKLSVKLVMGSALVRMYVLVDNADGNDWTTVGETFQSPLKYQPRGTLSTTWDGRLANRTLVGPGRYKMIVKALHIFGNSEMDADYDEAETVAFSVSYAP